MPQLVELGVAGACFGAAVACSAASWRAMLGPRLGFGDACARYGVGSLANTFLPGRAGDAVRIGLFGRVAPGGPLSVAGAVAGVGAVRWLALLPLAIAGVLGSGLPRLALAGAALALLPLPLVWLLARRGSTRARAVLLPLRQARRSTYAAVFAWVAGTLAARVTAAATTSFALGIAHPLATALVVVPALEVAGLVPLTPANVGVAGGAAAVAFHAHGVSMHTALATGFVLHAVETCAGLAFGVGSALALARTSGIRHQFVTKCLPRLSPCNRTGRGGSTAFTSIRSTTRGKMSHRILWVLGLLAVATAVTAAVATSSDSGPALTNVAAANTRSMGYAPDNRLSPELQQTIVAQGSTRAENPGAVSYYGYDNDKLNEQSQPVMIPTPTLTLEAHKTEPDKNTYLVFKKSLTGADQSYNYGTHFLFQGHESGSPGYITRINLDADAAHRLTVLATTDTTGANIATIDGSTWDPWAERLLFTTESPNAPTYSATPGFPSTVKDVSPALGRGGYEGIQDDSKGELWIAEDQSGSNKPGTVAKRPNSFLFRYVPAHPGDLQNGKLEALQVLNNVNGQPITFESQADLNNADSVALHTYGNTFKTKWVVVHDTATDLSGLPFNANTLAKAAHATPFKRPENGVFRPNSHFKEFYFDETGDTNAASPENNTAGGWGSVMKLTQQEPDADTGSLTMFFKATAATAGFDNVAFLGKDTISFVQDAGAGLHQSLNALDSAFAFNTKTDYSNPANQPVRWLAEGRDPSATFDAERTGAPPAGTGNEDDNEITGLHVSDGDTSKNGILGNKNPNLDDKHWRIFWTQQHGDNSTWEVTTVKRNGEGIEH